MQVKQTNNFRKKIKKLSTQAKKEVDKVVREIIDDPLIGELKKGDLSFVRTHKFKLNKQLTLLGYIYEESRVTLTFISLGSHENFYRDLKRQVH